MENHNGPWIIKNSQVRYKDDFMELKVDEVIKPDGQEGKYATVALRKGVAILPIDNEGMVYLARQFRYAIGKESIEVVCGGIDNDDEEPLETAKKELKQEAGIEAATWEYLGRVEMDTASVNCPIYLYLVKNLKFKQKEQESTENIKIFKKPLNTAFDMVMKNEITHTPSCILLLKAYYLLK